MDRCFQYILNWLPCYSFGFKSIFPQKLFSSNATEFEDMSVSSSENDRSPRKRYRIVNPLSGTSRFYNQTHNKPAFYPLSCLEDSKPVKCVEFHPKGEVYAVGSNMKTLRICECPDFNHYSSSNPTLDNNVLLVKTAHHNDDINCLAWNPAGDLLATGSSDNTVKLMNFESESCFLDGQEKPFLTCDGAVNDICFIQNSINSANLLVSGGAGRGVLQITDCATAKTFQTLSGHSGDIVSLFSGKNGMIVSGSQDNTVRLWDYRMGTCISTITAPVISFSMGSSVTCLDVDPSERQLVCGNIDGLCALYDMRVLTRGVHQFTPHTGAVRSVRFSPGGLYLLTAGDDGNIVLTNMQGDMIDGLSPSVTVARHPDQVISAQWHPERFSFVSTSFDNSSVFWAMRSFWRRYYNDFNAKGECYRRTLFQDLSRLPSHAPNYVAYRN